jgi:hypothetical protein
VNLFRASLVTMVAAAVAAALIAWPAVASAGFTTSSAAAHKVTSDTLSGPTGVTVKCLGSAQRVTITWTATTDTYATGYVIYGSYGGIESSQSVPGRTTTSYSPVTAVPAGTAITIVSIYRNWTSARTAAVAAPANCH